MPEVVNKTETTISATAVINTPADTHITKTEVQTAIDAIAKATALGSASYKADKARDAALVVVFGKLLGVKTLDEVKEMNEEQMSKLFTERLKSGAFTIENGVDFNIKLDGTKKSPAWKQGFIAKLGEAAANAFEAAAKVSYRWHIVGKTPPTKQ